MNSNRAANIRFLGSVLFVIGIVLLAAVGLVWVIGSGVHAMRPPAQAGVRLCPADHLQITAGSEQWCVRGFVANAR